MIYRAVQGFAKQRLFLFAGQGTQEKGMLGGLALEEWEGVLAMGRERIGVDLREVATTDAGNRINQTEVTQPLLLLSHYLHFHSAANHLSLSPQDYMIGHSLGQYSALVNSGSLSLMDGLSLVHQRGKLMTKHTLIPHSMLIIKFKTDREQVVLSEIKRLDLEIACVNSRTSIIVAGTTPTVAELMAVLKKARVGALLLPVSTAFHCRMLASMAEQFHQILQQTNFQPPKCTVLRNYDCQPYTSAADIRQGLLLQLTNPVLFHQSVQSVPPSAALIQVGHKPWISKFAEQTLGESQCAG